ncbi:MULTISPECIES: DUF3991 and toprim domain-containing protein [unclassified Rhizobium]|uniref:DUF3991 and toprim domain-containing protein n=1 Tax=unclassified Rhizobium TaxID=2613769 RepID=UPI00177EAEA4|nr:MULTISPECIES: DUF3991 and toprim domain-containing protein [unclassified Rhizobium]MBD8689508.1 DUF3991 and TOPRIM domain-containing protein [Rhizobium sp. CFBP 13644]MBD8693970.1 DUF3991 and TOPRIM domain-containing protein [Rhizobium sp. CFBP 13717]
MKRRDIEEIRERVGCGAVLATSGFAIDAKESTRRAVKYRRGGEIVIVTHGGQGWFDPLGDDKGDVFSLVARLDGGGFLDALDRVAGLIGFQSIEPKWMAAAPTKAAIATIHDRWISRRNPRPSSETWRYLRFTRFVPGRILKGAIKQGVLREGPYGSMWAGHVDEDGNICGWEERGPDWRGFATGGAKVLFRLGPSGAHRLCVTEAAIDAMSLAAIEGMREDTLYLSTGGGWSPNTAAALRQLARYPDVQLVAATDANRQGDAFAYRLREVADQAGCDWLRLRPPADDWNEVLKCQEREKQEKEGEMNGVPHSRLPRQGRLRPAAPAPDPGGHDAGGPGEVMED